MRSIAITIILMMSISSCSLFRYSDPKLRRVWMLSEFQNFHKDSLVAKKASIDMREKEYAKVYMGCNEVSYNYYNKHKSEIYFKGGLSATTTCADMSLEDKFNAVMQTITHYRIEGHKLILKTLSNEEYTFVAQDWD